MKKSVKLRGFKEGTYTVINGQEYELIPGCDEDRPFVELFTEDPNAIDDSFMYDDSMEGYLKRIDDPNIIRDAYKYKIEYVYKGHGYAGTISLGDIDEVTLWLDPIDSEEERKIAISSGFQQNWDRIYYKTVRFNEVEMKQIGPTRITYYKSWFD